MHYANLIYGLQNGEIVTIDKVEKGLSCNCKCPNCKSQLIAKKGKIREHHFAHFKNSDCLWRGESLIHKISKEIIASSKTLKLPKLVWSSNPEIIIFNETILKIDNVVLEKKIDDFIPDIIIQSKGKKLLVEIVYSHGIDYFKYSKIKSSNIPTIQINVNQLVNLSYRKKDFLLKSKEFRNEIINGTRYKSWVYNPELIKLKRILKNEYSKRYVIETLKSNSIHFDDLTYSEYCPIGIRKWKSGILKDEPYAKFHEDCKRCKYYLGVGEYKIIGSSTGIVLDTKPAIYCIGHMGSALDLDVNTAINNHKKKIKYE